MKKGIAFLSVLVLIFCFSAVCYAEGGSAAPEAGVPRAEQKAEAGDPALRAEKAAAFSSTSYRSSRQGSSVLSRVIAAAIVGAIYGGIKALIQNSSKKKAERNAMTGNVLFICRSCGQKTPTWSQNCPYCGKEGSMDRYQ